MRRPPRTAGATRGRRRLLALLAAVLAAGCRDADELLVYDLVAGAALAHVESERTALDVGAPSSRPFLETGFSWAERAADGRSFAWSSGAESVASFELHSIEPRRLLLRGTPYDGGDAVAPAAVELALNGHSLGKLELAAGDRAYTLDVGTELQRLGVNRLSIRYPRTYRAPSGGGSRRGIAVAWDVLALLTPEAEAPTDRQLDHGIAPAAELADTAISPLGPALRLATSAATTWTLDLAPGAELRLAGLEIGGSHGPQRLLVWIEEAGSAAPRLVGEVDPQQGTARLPLDLEVLTTARLTLATRRAPAGPGGWIDLRSAAVVYRLSSPSS